MSALDASIASLTAEYDALKNRLTEIDSAYRDRPTTIKELNRLAKALSTLTGQPVAGASGSMTPRKPMSEEAKARIKAGLERARAAKAANSTAVPETASSASGKPPQSVKTDKTSSNRTN